MRQGAIACIWSLGLAVVLFAGAQAIEAEDPFLWLEDIHGPKALEWVNGQNAVTLNALKSDPEYSPDYDALLMMLDADDRIPTGQLHGNLVFNFWQDKQHIRGIWRQTTIVSYETSNPKWETLLDIDELSAQEGKNWVFKGATCSAGLARCLLKLSPDGGDTVVLREFAPEEKHFVERGFSLGEAKAEAAYIDADTILFSTDFGTGTLTRAGLSANRKTLASRPKHRGREAGFRKQNRGRHCLAGDVPQPGRFDRAGLTQRKLFSNGIFLPHARRETRAASLTTIR